MLIPIGMYLTHSLTHHGFINGVRDLVREYASGEAGDTLLHLCILPSLKHSVNNTHNTIYLEFIATMKH